MNQMDRKLQILVVGYGEDVCTEKAYHLAYEVGRYVARSDAVLITGGLGGVMEAACKGSSEEGGQSVSIIPQDDPVNANPYAGIVISTGIGYARNFVTAYSGDAVIVVGGGAGTLSEVAAAYLKGKPIVCLLGSGGIADEIANGYLDDRKKVYISGEVSPEKVVEKAIYYVKKGRPSP